MQKALAFLAISSLLLSLVPIAQAAGETLTIKASDVKTQYVVGQPISMKVTIPEQAKETGFEVSLSADLGGEFSGGNLDGACTGSFTSTLDLTIASSTAQKAFCFKPTVVGDETVLAFFVNTETSQSIDLTVVEPVPVTCPLGMVGVPPACMPVVPPPVPVCPPGMMGIPPVCMPVIAPPVVVDVCPNIPEVQTVIPEGLVIDDSMNCVEDIPELVCKSLIQNGSFEDPVADLNTFGAGKWEVFESIPGWTSVDGIEVWNTMFGGASDGLQNLELGVATSTTISQVVETEIGAEYELQFAFSARPGTGATENNISVAVNSIELLTADADGATIETNTWTQYQQSFVATATTTTISFADIGTPNGLGTLLDDVQLCYIAEPVYGCTDSDASNFDETATIDDESCVYGEEEFDTYRIEGYLWHDSDRNQEWEGFGREERNGGDERPLSDWEVTITDGKRTYTTVSDTNGFYFFEVPAGTWTITSVMERGWRGTTEQSYTLTVPVKVDDVEPSLVSMIRGFIIPTAHAAVLDTFGPYNFGIVKTSGGGTSGSSTGGDGDGPDGSVAGVSTTTAPTAPLVLGEQVSVVPIGAPNTGSGGLTVEVVGYFAVLPRKSFIVR